VTFPILIECDLQESEGLIFRRRCQGEEDSNGRGHNDVLPVRVLPLDTLKSVEKYEGEGQFRTRYGTVSRRTRVKLRTVNFLVQEVQSADGKRLGKYVHFKTAEEASEEARDNDFSEYGLGDLLYDEEYKRLEPGIQKQVVSRVTGDGRLIAELSAELDRIALAKLVLWWRSKERDLAAGIYCADIDAALFALLLSRTVMPQGTAICTRCWKLYTRSRVAQKFCSRRCGNAVRQAQKRAKQKQKVRDAPPL
jgi:hypothetical protein